MKRLNLLDWIVFAILFVTVPVFAHEVFVLPTSLSSGPADSIDSAAASRLSGLLPVIIHGDHLLLSAASLSFGSVDVGDSVSRSLTLTNASTHIVSVAFEAPTAALSLSPSALTLQPAGSAGDSTTVTLTWSPKLDDALTGSLTLVEKHTGARAARSSVPLSGSTVSVISISPNTLHFGLIDRYDSRSKTITVTNVSAEPQMISVRASSWEIAGVAPATDQTLGPAGTAIASQTYTVVFDTNGLQRTFSGHLTITPATSSSSIPHTLPVTGKTSDLGGPNGLFDGPLPHHLVVVRGGATD